MSSFDSSAPIRGRAGLTSSVQPTVGVARILESMTSIALFHSVLGVRPGIHAAAERLRAAGHDVRVVDQYDGRVFDDYQQASTFAGSIGYPALMGRAVEAVADLPDGFVAAGLSNGGGMGAE